MKTTQQWGFRGANDIDIVLNQVRVYHDNVYADNVVSKFGYLRSFFSPYHSKIIADIANKNLPQVGTEKFKTGSLICKVNLKFLRSADTFTVIQLSL